MKDGPTEKYNEQSCEQFFWWYLLKKGWIEGWVSNRVMWTMNERSVSEALESSSYIPALGWYALKCSLFCIDIQGQTQPDLRHLFHPLFKPLAKIMLITDKTILSLTLNMFPAKSEARILETWRKCEGHSTGMPLIIWDNVTMYSVWHKTNRKTHGTDL